MGIDVTDMVVCMILLVSCVVAGAIAYCWRRWVHPWLELHHLEEAAEIVVNAVEAIFGRYVGDVKWDEAIKRMEGMGFVVDDQRVLDALKAAWKKLDMAQLAIGEKEIGGE